MRLTNPACILSTRELHLELVLVQQPLPPPLPII
jgi:hypothetical protein